MLNPKKTIIIFVYKKDTDLLSLKILWLRTSISLLVRLISRLA